MLIELRHRPFFRTRMTTCCRSLSLSQAKTAQRTAATQNAIDDFMEQFARMRQLTHLMVALNRAGHPQFERFHFVVHIAQHAAVAAEPEAEREPEAEEDAGAASVPPGESSLKLILAEVERVSALLDAWREALSAALRKLEEELGTELFHRTGHGVEATEAGKVFIEHAKITLRAAGQTTEAVRSLVGLETGSIRVGAGATATGYLLPGAIQAVRKKHPGLRFSIKEAGSAQVAQGVLSGELDLGVVTLPIEHPRADEHHSEPNGI